jgi:hypothetical protein
MSWLFISAQVIATSRVINTFRAIALVILLTGLSLYPPAHTTVNIEQAALKTDSFGNALVVQLRAKGYAVQIIDPKQPVKAVAGINLNYTVDNPAARWYIGLYRVQLVVGNVTLTRAYSEANNTAMPAGAWAKME